MAVRDIVRHQARGRGAVGALGSGMRGLWHVLRDLFHVSGSARTLYLEDRYVKPHLRAKGIGFALLKPLVRIADRTRLRQVGVGSARLEPASHPFYKRLGAVPMNEWTKYRLTGEARKSL